MATLLDLANLIFSDVTETVEDLEKKFEDRKLPENAYVTRFAPSPTGFLHTGSLFTSMIACKMAKTPEVYAVSAACPTSAIVNGLGFNGYQTPYTYPYPCGCNGNVLS